MVLAMIIAGSAVSGYIVPIEAAKLIQTNDIANAAVTTPKIADGAVSLAKFASGVATSLSGTNGINGTDGANGINCWDLNGNRVNDANEDKNNDNAFNALDCQGSAQSIHNTAPVVEAGSPQQVTGTLTPGNNFFTLTCSFPLNGDVQDDVFTGYLNHTWSGAFQSLGAQFTFDEADQLTTTAHFAAVIPGAFPPTSGVVSLPAQLRADDGIFVITDTIDLGCAIPAS
jgi:hypothetical protein